AVASVPNPSAVLPFLASRAPQTSRPQGERPDQTSPAGPQATGLPHPSVGRAIGQAPIVVGVPASGPELPTLTVEQYAELCVEIRLQPTRAKEVCARYGIV